MLVAGGLVDVEVLGSLGATVEVMGLTLLLLLELDIFCSCVKIHYVSKRE